MSTVFDRDTAVTSLGDGTYEAAIGEAWQIVHGPNGGYLASVIQNAMTREVDDPGRSIRSLTVHFLRAAPEGTVRIEVVKEREGKSVTSVSARLFDGDRLLAIALGAFSSSFPSIELDEAPMPDVAPPDEIEVFPVEVFPRHLQNFVYKHALGDALFTGSDRAEVGAWIRLAEPRLLDPLMLTTLADTAPPSVFPRLDRPNAAPTIDLTVHFRSPIPDDVKPEDFYLVVVRSKLSRDGFFEEDGEIYTESGLLLAQSRQLALLLPPRE